MRYSPGRKEKQDKLNNPEKPRNRPDLGIRTRNIQVVDSFDHPSRTCGPGRASITQCDFKSPYGMVSSVPGTMIQPETSLSSSASGREYHRQNLESGREPVVTRFSGPPAGGLLTLFLFGLSDSEEQNTVTPCSGVLTISCTFIRDRIMCSLKVAFIAFIRPEGLAITRFVMTLGLLISRPWLTLLGSLTNRFNSTPNAKLFSALKWEEGRLPMLFSCLDHICSSSGKGPAPRWPRISPG